MKKYQYSILCYEKNRYESINKLIADCCKDMGVIEKYGSGIGK